MLVDLPEGSVIFDCPVGAGRFLAFYAKHGFDVIGMDINRDMLDQAVKKKAPSQDVELRLGDVRAKKLADKSVDASVMVRMTRWLDPEDCVRALRELQRVTRKRIIFTARVRNPPHARGYYLIEGSLQGWHITRDEAASEPDYRVIALEPDVLA